MLAETCQVSVDKLGIGSFDSNDKAFVCAFVGKGVMYELRAYIWRG